MAIKLLKVQGVKKYFGQGARRRLVLDDVSFDLDAGARLGIVGRSGCGKSTLVKIIARLFDSDDGLIVFDGKDITRTSGAQLRSVYRRMQMIFQSPEDSFNPRRTLGWSIGEPLRSWSIPNAEARVEELLNIVGLPREFALRYPHEVSGGQCQRAAIARALALEPKLLICDEATSALDVTVQEQVVDLLRRLSVEKGIALLFITHDLALLPRIVDRVLVMSAGRVVEAGAVNDVIERPQSARTRELMSADFFSMEVN